MVKRFVISTVFVLFAVLPCLRFQAYKIALVGLLIWHEAGQRLLQLPENLNFHSRRTIFVAGFVKLFLFFFGSAISHLSRDSCLCCVF